MTRAEMRRNQKLRKKSETATYNLTQAQLDAMVRESVKAEIEKTKKEATEDAVRTAMTLMFTLPLEVLMKYYWPKSYAKRLPEFVNHILEYYEKWENGEIDIEDLREDLWIYGGIRIEETEG